jgi:TonB family protein
VAHVLLLAGLVQRTHGSASATKSVSALATAAAEMAAEPVLIDVVMIDSATPALIGPQQEPAPRLWAAVQADRDHDVPLTIAPRLAADAQPARPAPDRGSGGGHTPSAAWRRDQTALQARVTDGATVAQPSRQRTADHASSPQAIRRERVVGIGDATRTRTPARLPAAAQYAAPDQGTEEKGAGTTEGTQAGAAAAVDVPRVADAVVADRGQGPLDAEQGKRTFDDEQRGPAADDRALRLASSERQPGIADFSHPAATAKIDTNSGQGPGLDLGAVARPSAGTAPSETGAAAFDQRGPVVSERTRDRRYDHYIQEIVGRVNRERTFPKALALRLEQGETIVFFTLRADGKISDGVRVVKSSGFDEFDSEAVRAVLRAAPFPPMPDPANARPIPMSMRVGFDNPVVR